MFRVYVHDEQRIRETALSTSSADRKAEVDAWVCSSSHVDGAAMRLCESDRKCVYETYDDAVSALVLEHVDLISASNEEKRAITNKKRAFKERLAATKLDDDPKERKLLEYAEKNKISIHSKGMVVFAPPGSGKTTFVEKHKSWSDVDDIAYDMGLHTEHWEQRHSKRAEHYKTIDEWLEIMKRVGFHVMGSLYWNYIPDAIVLIPETTHKAYVNKRDDLKWEDVQPHRDFLMKLAREHGIRIYSSFAKLVMVDA